MKPGLTHTQIKLGRAYAHFDQLVREVNGFLGNDPYTISKKDDPEHGVHFIRFKENITPDAIGFLPGEFAYCLRSCLDHLAWNLALLTKNDPAPNTQFPIQAEFTKRSQERFASQTQDIPSDAVKIIKALQPYQNRAAFQSNLLWQLDKLCNTDKHRFITFQYADIPYEFSVPVRWQGTADGFEVTCALSDKGNFQFKPGAPVVVFGDPVGVNPLVVSLERMGEIYKFIRYDVVPRFEIFFPK